MCVCVCVLLLVGKTPFVYMLYTLCVNGMFGMHAMLERDQSRAWGMRRNGSDVDGERPSDIGGEGDGHGVGIKMRREDWRRLNS